MSLQTLSRWGRSAYDTAAAWAEEAEDLAALASEAGRGDRDVVAVCEAQVIDVEQV